MEDTRMARPKRSSAEEKANALLDQYQFDATIPVPVFQVIQALQAQVVYQRMGPEVSGMTYREGKRAVIGLNSAHHPRRQRFTAAHEVGHIVLHPGRPLTIDSNIRVNFRDPTSSLATDTEEIEANAFAAALLMPAKHVVSEAEDLVNSGVRSRDRLVAELAARFDVSPEAMGYRLINLGIASAP
jgi:Zn-dependent peptidase ImmA (M78 family)